MTTNDQSLFETVIKNDYCIGCGACAVIKPDQYSISFDKYSMFKATINSNSDAGENNGSETVCPFSDEALNEDIIGELVFPNAPKKSEYLGRYITAYAGHVAEGDYRTKGSSGGLGKWLLNELLETKQVDYIIQIVAGSKDNHFFDYKVFQKGDDIIIGSTSAYYPVRIDGAIDFILKNEGHYAITALPCMSKAIRLLCEENSLLKKRIKFVIGVVCGHLKSRAFAELFAWQLGVTPDNLKAIEFRGKLPGKKANDKGVFVTDNNGRKSKTVSSKKLVGGNWGHCLFKYNACDYCDDVLAETADISVGDAWLDEYIDDYQGSNIAVVRNEFINSLIEQATLKKRISFQIISEDKIVKSQAGGFRHRREGLAYRLYKKQKNQKWAPTKRVKPENIKSVERKKIYDLREHLSRDSHIYFLKAKQKDNLRVFINHFDKQILGWPRYFLKKLLKSIYLIDILKKTRRYF